MTNRYLRFLESASFVCVLDILCFILYLGLDLDLGLASGLSSTAGLSSLARGTCGLLAGCDPRSSYNLRNDYFWVSMLILCMIILLLTAFLKFFLFHFTFFQIKKNAFFLELSSMNSSSIYYFTVKYNK